MIFSRELINKNIIYHDWIIKDNYFQKQTYEFNRLSSLVDAYKNLFILKGAVTGQTVIIGNKISIEQLALFLACAELGLIITMIGYPFSVTDHRKQIVNLRYPGTTDFFIVKNNTCTKKFEIFKEFCNNTIILDQEILDYSTNNEIRATSDTVLLKCASNNRGTIDKPIHHTHDFFTKILFKTAILYGKIGVSLDNLSHGSNPSTHFLSGLVSDKVTDYYNFNIVRNCNILLARQLEKNNIFLDHLIVPYPHLAEGKFFDSEVSLHQCIMYTLGYFQKDWINKFKGKVKDVVRIYGTSESYEMLLVDRITDHIKDP